MATTSREGAGAALDPAIIAELANAVFAAAPGSSLPPAGPGAALPSAPMPRGVPMMPVALASPGLPPASTSLATPAVAPPSPPLPGAALPSVPLLSPPLADAPAPTATTPPGPGDAVDYAALPQSLSTAMSVISLSPTATPVPGLAEPSSDGAFYFLADRVPANVPAAPPVPGRDSVTSIAAAGERRAAAPPGDDLPRADVDFNPSLQQQRTDQVPDLGVSLRPFNPHAVRRDFPILQQTVHGRPLVWLDNGATTQKPNAVIERLSHFYRTENSNVHRGAHTLAARSTDAYEDVRGKIQRFIGAGDPHEIVFVRGTTEGINLVAQSWGRANITAGDEILITWLEHHANIVPWQQLCAVTGARLRVAPVDDSGQIILSEFERLLGPRTRLVAITAVANALGTVTPITEMTAAAHRVGAVVLVDGAQSVSHMPTNVQAIGCDFFVLSGHKMFGPTGIGVVYGRRELLEAMPPWQGGGNMIADVTFERTLYHGAPERFEAGTGNIADAVGLGAAVDYLERIGMTTIQHYEHGLLEYATLGLATVPGLKLIGTAREKASVLSFTLAGRNSEEVGKALDQEGIAVRAGHHCAQPILRRFGLESTVRASLAFYNTCEDVDALVAALKRIQLGPGSRPA
jgi:cysteine desulfurase/selenocysteine lyase